MGIEGRNDSELPVAAGCRMHHTTSLRGSTGMRVHGHAHSKIITLSSLAGRAAPSAGKGAGALALASATCGFSASDV